MAAGATAYDNYCASCHKPDGTGVPGTFPPLQGSARVSADKTELIKLLLNGLSGPITVAGVKYDMEMPAFSFLSDQEVADVVQYVRQTFGQKRDKVTAAEVARLRAK
jgi:aldose sugar dehydrogenase